MAFSRVAVVPLVAEHVSETAFLWERRDAATRRFAYDLASLGRLDERIDANLDGLRVAETTGLSVALAALEEEPEPGGAFVAAKLALDRSDMAALARVLDQTEASPVLWPAVPSAIAFCAFDAVETVLRALTVPSVPPPLLRMGIAGYAAHRRDPGPALGAALRGPHRALRLAALEAVGALRAAGLREALSQLSPAADDEEAFWMARAQRLLGDRRATGELERLAQAESGPLAARAAALAAAGLDPTASLEWVRRLDELGSRRLALAAAAASGVGALLPWIATCMAEADHARLAGFAFYAITGVRVEDALEGSRPEAVEPKRSTDEDEDGDADEEGDADEAEDAVDPDEDLPWPEPVAVVEHLSRTRYDEGRLLLGRPLDAAWLQTVLRDAPQPIREIADWHYGWLRPGEPAFPLRAPAWRQRALCGAAPETAD